MLKFCTHIPKIERIFIVENVTTSFIANSTVLPLTVVTEEVNNTTGIIVK